MKPLLFHTAGRRLLPSADVQVLFEIWLISPRLIQPMGAINVARSA